MKKGMNTLDIQNKVMALITYNMPTIKLEGMLWNALSLRERGRRRPVFTTSYVWRTLSQSYILLVIICLISMDPADAQRLGEDDMGKDQVSIGVPTTAENTLLLHEQGFCEPAPYCSRGSGVPSGSLRSQTAPMTLLNSVVQEYPVQVQPVFVMRVVSI